MTKREKEWFAVLIGLMVLAALPGVAGADDVAPFEIYNLIQEGANVRIATSESFEGRPYVVFREGENNSKIVYDNTDLSDGGPWEILDECVPPGSTTYEVVNRYNNNCFLVDGETISVTDVGQQCPTPSEALGCDIVDPDDDDSNSGCQLSPAGQGRAFSLLRIIAQLFS